ncbi:MAG: alpha/beta hydrolase [Pseudomonadota bacterium]
MFVSVNGARLYFDVEGAGLVPDGPAMRERPTLLLLHGGPGADHSIHKPVFSALTDVAQVVYLDHRGNGRSEGDDPADWTLAQWGDDVRAFCEALGIERPVVCGTSFGGFVAQAYATRHPDHPGALILASTAAHFDFEETFAAFERLGGPEVRAAAEGYWRTPSSESRARYREICVPYYWASADSPPDWLGRAKMRDDVAIHFNGPANEQGRMDFRNDLARITCPVLVLSGTLDPITPPVFSDVIAEHLTNAPITFQRFVGAGHGIMGDETEAGLAAIRSFIRDLDG